MYKDLSLKEKAKVLLYGGKLGLTSVEDIAKLYDDAIGHTFQTKGLMEVDNYNNRPTLNEYLAKRAAEEQQKYYLEGSRNRKESEYLYKKLSDETKQKLGYVTKQGNKELLNTVRQFSDKAGIPIATAFNYLESGKYPKDWNGKYEYWYNTYNDIKTQVNNAKYDLKENKEFLANCIATATSNNPNPGHYVTGNQTFRANPGRYGWKEVSKEEIKPGGVIQLGSPVSHALILDSNEGENMYVNYSPGTYPEYKKHINIETFNDPQWKNRYYYNFVGNSADSTRWVNEYNLLYGTLYAKGGPIVSPYGQWLFNGKKKKEDTIIPSNNITMANVNYPVLGISDTGDTKVMMPWNDYKFRGSVVYEHPLVNNQFQLGGNTLNYLNVPEYNIALYNTVSPLGDFPNFWEALAYKRLVKDKLKNGNIYERDYKVEDTQGEKTAMAAWAKRLGIPYDEQDLPVYNGDTVTLPYSLVLEIPYDTNVLKNRIQLNKALLDKYSKYRYSDVVDAAIKADLYNLDKLRETYKTGKPVGLTEFGWNSRLLVDNGEIVPIENIQSPLNVLGNYNVRYSPKERRLYYSDEYDFNQFENFVPGEPYRIRGYIDLDNNKALGGNLFKKGGIYIKPENRGKFTALKKRTGHSASWFKAHGTPALKKMAVFALNSKKWHHKHDEGGYLYSEGGFLLAPYLYNE